MKKMRKTVNPVGMFLVTALLLITACSSGGSSEGAGETSVLDKIKPGADLRKEKLAGVDLKGGNMPRVNLGKVDLSGANLSGANLYKAMLIEANLTNADLTGANLYMADLRGAKLGGAKLSKTDLSGAELYKADIAGATCDDGTKLPKGHTCTDGKLAGGE